MNNTRKSKSAIEGLTPKSLLSDIKLALDICFVADIGQVGENLYLQFANGKKFKLYLEEI